MAFHIRKNIQTNICKISLQASCFYQSAAIFHQCGLALLSLAQGLCSSYVSLLAVTCNFYDPLPLQQESLPPSPPSHRAPPELSTFKSCHWCLILQLSCWHVYECATAIHLLSNDLTSRINQLLHNQAGHFMLSNIRRVRQTKKGSSHKDSRTMKHVLSCSATVPLKATVQTSSV